MPSFVKMSDLATHLEDKCSGKIAMYIRYASFTISKATICRKKYVIKYESEI